MNQENQFNADSREHRRDGTLPSASPEKNTADLSDPPLILPEPFVFAPTPEPLPDLEPLPVPHPAPEGKTLEVQPTPETQDQSTQRGNRIGRLAALAAAALVVLLVAGIGLWKYTAPQRRYQTAQEAEAAGNYQEAVELYRSIPDYKDSPQRLAEAQYRWALQKMNQGDYAGAMELLEPLEDYRQEVANCLYALAVLAYNEGDLDAALDYAKQLQERFPGYENTELLLLSAQYDEAVQWATLAAQKPNPQTALDLYNKALKACQGLSDLPEAQALEKECRYRIALLYRDMGEKLRPIQDLAALGDYRDAVSIRQDLMFEYVQLHMPYGDETAYAYLKELAEAGHPQGKGLWDRLQGVGFHFELTFESGSQALILDLNAVGIDYDIDVWDQDARPTVILLCVYPDNRSFRAMLTADGGGTRGSRTWAQLGFPTYCEHAGFVELRFYDSLVGVNDQPPLYTTSFWYDPEPTETAALPVEEKP